jgi:hypothetical protein
MEQTTWNASKALLTLAKERLDRHPVLASMATRLDVNEGRQHQVTGLCLNVVFDGPALPQKHRCELFVPTPTPELGPEMIDGFLDGCETSVAAEMRKAGLGG